MEDSGQPHASQGAITVSELNRKARFLLEKGIARIWVEGEISNLARPASGHLYFSLKDKTAQIRAAFFRQRQRGPTIGLKNGDQIVAYGKVSLYEARGDYQLIVERVESAGEGALKRQFEVLKKKLTAEGLFDEDRKQALPALPGRIGVITSPSGAAIRDVISVLRRRFPAIPVVIYPSAVQGEAAAPELVTALNTAIDRNECDVLIIGRGGGSLEDLWAFNEEVLARAVADCPIPIVSAVGHEVDFTICDFVADVRAPTPSGAAELVVPDSADWQRRTDVLAHRIARLGQRALEQRSQTLDWLARRLSQSSPAATVRQQRSRLREAQQQLRAALKDRIAKRDRQLAAADRRLRQASPALAVQRSIAGLAELRLRLRSAADHQLSDLKHRLTIAAKTMHTVSPLATLDRGYAIVERADTGQLLTDAKKVTEGDAIRARLGNGQLEATVTRVSKHAD